jgi:hypothetical protein
VFKGRKEKTRSGITKSDLVKNKRGKIVSRKAAAHGKKRFAAIRGWLQAVQAARKQLNIRGFVGIGGKTAQGKALYAKAKAIYKGK